MIRGVTKSYLVRGKENDGTTQRPARGPAGGASRQVSEKDPWSTGPPSSEADHGLPCEVRQSANVA